MHDICSSNLYQVLLHTQTFIPRGASAQTFIGICNRPDMQEVKFQKLWQSDKKKSAKIDIRERLQYEICAGVCSRDGDVRLFFRAS